MVWTKLATSPTSEIPVDIDMVGLTFRGEEYCAGRCYVRAGRKTYPAMAISNGERKLITTDEHAPAALAAWGCGIRNARRIIKTAIRQGAA